MAVKVAEYLGTNAVSIQPDRAWKAGSPVPDCPFMGGPCAKINRSEPQKPICSVWADGRLWIICEHRLLSAKKDRPIDHPYLAKICGEITREIWGDNLPKTDIAVKRQHTIGTSSADYIFAFNPGWRVIPLPLRFVLEIQGGGPTSNSKEMSTHVGNWESAPESLLLDTPVAITSADIRGAWKRLLEQLFTKGLAATKVRQGIGCAVGETFFDAVNGWVKWAELEPPEDKYVDFIVIPYRVVDPASSPIALEPHKERIVRSSFRAFLDQLQKVGIEADFSGSYKTLGGDTVDGS